MNKLNIRLTNATDCELEFLAERLGLTEAAVVSRAIEAMYGSMENDMTTYHTINKTDYAVTNDELVFIVMPDGHWQEENRDNRVSAALAEHKKEWAKQHSGWDNCPVLLSN